MVRGVVRLLRQLVAEEGGTVGRVVARIRLYAAVFKMQDTIDHAVEEIAIVRDDQDGALEPTQEVLQPSDAAEVQMVGRLIQ